MALLGQLTPTSAAWVGALQTLTGKVANVCQVAVISIQISLLYTKKRIFLSTDVDVVN